ncbi:tetratricopeptide repeat protein [Roseospira visakhapatnamensis]|uniref:Tetratricopeptide (TPR) repeat protein n=1 Tax=Roseospira visakhapatnamensis TaxID=390880 RepID=A0A7W6RFE0_9PROT|nr:tetratricopeptide repeat protein [Roseospira visakhapatnamensis]MBB4266923.1 tetratricopeptide (TPR) repeat protein [Roseospira visakhapatnamensis]
MPDPLASARTRTPASTTSAPSSRALLVEGLRRHKAGQVREALALYRRAVILDPGLTDGWHMLGAASLQQGDAEAALAPLERSRHLAPRDALLQANLAHAWRALGCHAEAAAALATAIALDPARAEPWQDLGLMAAERGLRHDAERCLAHAAHLRPEPGALVRHANALLALGRRDRAENRLGIALRLTPDHLGARLARAGARRALGDIDGALADARAAVALSPNAPGPAGALGTAHLHGGRLPEAIRWRGRAARLAPAKGTSWLDLGQAAIAVGPGESAATALKRAVAADPALPAAYDALAEVRRRQGQWAAARRLLDWRLRLAPDPAVSLRRALHLPVMPESEAALDAAHERLLADLDALETDATPRGPNADPLAALAVSPDALEGHGRDTAAVMSRVAQVARGLCPGLTHTARLAAAPLADAPLRLVVLLPPEDPAPQDSLAPLAARLSPDLAARPDLSVTVLRPPGAPSIIATDPASAAGATTPLPADLDQARAMIADLRPDGLLAVDPMASPLTWALVFGRLAPVQAMILGRPATSGIATLDYVLTAAAWHDAEAQRRHTERLIRLRGLPLRLPSAPPHASLRRADLGLPPPGEARLYLALADPGRFPPLHDRAWVDLLRRDTRGVLMLPGGPHRSLAQRLLDRWRRLEGGPAVLDRVRVLPSLRRPHLLGVARLADAVLDAPGAGAGATVMEAMTLGVPAVTLAGSPPGTGVVAGLYRHWGITDLVARDPVHFVNLALRLARHEDWRREIGARLAQAALDPDAGAAVAAEIALFFRVAREAAAEGRRLTAWPGDDA